MQDAGMDTPPVDASFVGTYMLPQGGGVACAGSTCSVGVMLVPAAVRGYIMDVTGTAMIGTNMVSLACSFMSLENTGPQMLGSMMGSCSENSGVALNATAVFALQTTVDGGLCNMPELSISITAMDSTQQNLRFGNCP